jgi:hypothetical protein
MDFDPMWRVRSSDSISGGGGTDVNVTVAVEYPARPSRTDGSIVLFFLGDLVLTDVKISPSPDDLLSARHLGPTKVAQFSDGTGVNLTGGSYGDARNTVILLKPRRSQAVTRGATFSFSARISSAVVRETNGRGFITAPAFASHDRFKLPYLEGSRLWYKPKVRTYREELIRNPSGDLNIGHSSIDAFGPLGPLPKDDYIAMTGLTAAEGDPLGVEAPEIPSYRVAFSSERGQVQRENKNFFAGILLGLASGLFIEIILSVAELASKQDENSQNALAVQNPAPHGHPRRAGTRVAGMRRRSGRTP